MKIKVAHLDENQPETHRMEQRRIESLLNILLSRNCQTRMENIWLSHETPRTYRCSYSILNSDPEPTVPTDALVQSVNLSKMTRDDRQFVFEFETYSV